MKTPDATPDTPDDAWDDLFRQRLADHTDQPPADALGRILAGTAPPRPWLHGYWAPAGVALLLLLVGVGGWFSTRLAGARPKPAAEVTYQKTPQTKLATVPASARKIANPVTDGQPEPATRILARTELPDQRADLRSRGGDRPDTKPVGTSAGPALAQKASVTNPSFKDKRTSPRSSGRTSVATNRPGRSARRPVAGSARNENDVEPSVSRVAQRGGVGLAQSQSVRPLSSRSFRALTMKVALPAVLSAGLASDPHSSQPVRRLSWFAGFTPLYTYQQVNPIRTDAELLSDFRVAHSLATDRLGGRLQLGTQWRLAERLSLRTSLVYQQIRQSLGYTVRAIRPDSVQVVVENQSVQVTPVFTRQYYAETATRHYAGISADLAWQLNRSGRWQHFLTAGVTLGRYAGHNNTVNGFLQAAYSVERPLAPGLWLRLEPTVQLGWQPLTDPAKRLQSRSYGYGLGLALRFR